MGDDVTQVGAQAPAKPEPALVRRVADAIKPLASLRLTVVLLLFSMLLVFAGTWAQKDLGLWTVLETCFRAWFARVEVAGGWGVWMPGGYLLGVLLLANLLAAHTTRFQLSWKRSGVLLIHGGLVILLVGELVTAVFAVESRMSLTEGQTLDFTTSVREAELVLIDEQQDRDLVVAVPEALLVTGGVIHHALLPCDLRVVAAYKNARLQDRDGTETGPQADKGFGTRVALKEVPEVAGVGGEGIDLPALIVSAEKDGASLGSWLGWVAIEDEQVLQGVGDRPWKLALRFRRYYKDWSLQLLDFSHDRYTGTNVARNFSSRVRLRDPSAGEDREVTIAMNAPLRYRGETVYQSSFDPNDERRSILQVVRNPGWTLPYIAVTVGALGMLVHFGLALARFLRRQRATNAALEPSTVMRGLPWALLGLISAWLLWGMALAPGPETGAPYDLRGFGRIPVSYGGRIKPLDTLARNAATAIYGRETLSVALDPSKPAEKERLEAIEWLLRVIARPERSDEAKVEELRVFRIRHPDVLGMLGLPRELEEAPALVRIVSGAHPRRYAYTELAPHRQKIWEQARRADGVESRKRDPFERAVLELHGQLALFDDLATLGSVHAVPPLGGAADWETLEQARGREVSTAAGQRFVDMLVAFQRGGPEGPRRFSEALARWEATLQLEKPDAVRGAAVEVWFHRAGPFERAKLLFFLAGVLVAASWIKWPRVGTTWSDALQRAGLGALAVAILVTTIGLAVRIWLMGRPPVTNLYSSALFVGWVVALAALVLERVFRGGTGALVGAAAGWLAITLSNGLAGENDTMAVLQAVLDTNFWLATHVVAITVGYAACFCAGMLGIVAVLRGLLTRSLDAGAAHRLASMTYGTVCFATLFSFVGTILGGIWADQSWGRFWGWDPKENGALLIVLWNAVILHARWGGLVRERGLFLLAIGGNVVTAWSWFGTNMLGVGLHAYGFMESALFWLLAFNASQLALIGAGLLPPATCWRSDPWTKPPLAKDEPAPAAPAEPAPSP